MFRKGFTLVEIVVAVAISTLLLAWTVGIAVRATNSLANEKAKAQTYSALSDALSKLNSVRNAFPIATVVDVPNGYDFVVFTNSGQTAGVLVGIADAWSGSSDFRLDSASGYQTYGEKVLFVQDMTATQTASVLSDTQYAYSIPVREESLFRKLVAESFQTTAYNAGKIVDAFISVYLIPREDMNGHPKSSFPEFPATFNIVL